MATRWGYLGEEKLETMGYHLEHCHQGEAVDNGFKIEKHWETTTVSALGQPTLAQPT